MRRYGESPQHEKAKERIAQLFEAKGWNVELEKAFDNPSRQRYPYYVDIYAENFSLYNAELHNGRIRYNSKDAKLPRGCLRVICEVQGSRGKGNHSTKIHRDKDRRRKHNIRSSFGKSIIFLELWDWQLKGSSDEQIWQEIQWQLLSKQTKKDESGTV